jgi:hypothetical protein
MKPRYLALALLVLLAVDCDVFNPRTTTQFQTSSNAVDVFARNDTLLVAAGDSSLLAFDITKPKSPRELWHTNLGRDCRCVIAKGAAAYVGTDSGVVVYNLPTGDRTWQYVGGAGQVVTALAADSTRLFAATTDGVTVFDLTSPDPVKYIPMAGEPTGLARRDSRLFVSLRDWGVRVFNILPGDSFVLDTLRLGRHCRAEGVTVSTGGYCIISQGDSGILTYYTPAPDSFPFGGGGGGGGKSAYAAAATDGVEQAAFYLADSSTVTFTEIINRPGTGSFSEEIGPDLHGFTRRICLGGNGYVYTASGDAGIYIIRE